MEINTLFQLICDQESGRLDDCEVMLPMPDLFAYLLTGTVSTERSIASTTQMVSAKTGTWDEELLSLFHIPHRILPEIVESGTDKGTLSPAVQQRLGLPAIRVAAVCGHDTQCAAFAAPAKTERHIFLSCGTWSLFGTELEQPVLTEQAAALALSNEVGYGKKVTLLKNIIGLWLLQESRREYARQGENYSFAEIETMARQCTSRPVISTRTTRFSHRPEIFRSVFRRTAAKPDSISLKRRVPFSAAFMRAWR